jgi:hypothetical protein
VICVTPPSLSLVGCAARSLSLVGCAALSLLLVGCAALSLSLVGCAGSRGATTPIGMSDAAPEKAASQPAVVAPRTPWPDFAAARAWPEAAPASLSLGHRRDGTLIHVRVEPSALSAYRELAAEAVMPEGARIVAWHEAPTGALLGGYLLEKRAGVWSAQELDATGALLAGDHASCVRCHDMAPTDHLFGPRSTPPSSPALGGESLDPQRR